MRGPCQTPRKHTCSPEPPDQGGARQVLRGALHSPPPLRAGSDRHPRQPRRGTEASPSAAGPNCSLGAGEGQEGVVTSQEAPGSLALGLVPARAQKQRQCGTELIKLLPSPEPQFTSNYAL